MKIEILKVGQLSTNCYLAYDEINKEGVVIDPGADHQKILAKIKELGLQIKYIIFTHAHFDHILVYHEIKAEWEQAELIVCKRETDALSDTGINMLYYSNKKIAPIKADILAEEEDTISFGNEKLKVIETPGHTKGSMCLYSDHILISGDTLFQYSIGRCDFPTGSLRDEVDSIVNKLFHLPSETVVYPGHGEKTTIGFEKENNEVYRWISALN